MIGLDVGINQAHTLPLESLAFCSRRRIAKSLRKRRELTKSLPPVSLSASRCPSCFARSCKRLSDAAAPWRASTVSQAHRAAFAISRNGTQRSVAAIQAAELHCHTMPCSAWLCLTFSALCNTILVVFRALKESFDVLDDAAIPELTSLVKLLIKEMDPPLIPEEHYKEFIRAAKYSSKQARAKVCAHRSSWGNGLYQRVA